MFSACIHPHRLRSSGPNENERFVELNCFSIGGEYLLMESCIPLKHFLNHLSSDALALELWLNEHVRIVDDHVTVRDRVANTDQLPKLRAVTSMCECRKADNSSFGFSAADQ